MEANEKRIKGKFVVEEVKTRDSFWRIGSCLAIRTFRKNGNAKN